MTSRAGGAESVTAVVSQPREDEGEERWIELTSDFIPSDALELPADVRLVAPEAARDGPATLRMALPDDEAASFLDTLLRLGYHIRQSASDAAGGEVQELYVRAEGDDPVRLHAAGDLAVARGAVGGFALTSGGDVRLERGAQWVGDVDAQGDVWLEAGATLDGSVRAAGLLTLEEGARVEGALHVGRVRFLSDDPFATAVPGRPRPPAAAPPVQASAPAPAPALAPAPAQTLVVPAPAAPPEPKQIDILGLDDADEDGDSQGAADAYWLSPFPGRYRIVAKVGAVAEEVPAPVRAHLVEGELLEVEVLEASPTEVWLLLHPGTEIQRRIVCTADEAKRDAVLWSLLPVFGRLTTLRMVYGDGVLGVRASTESIRWLITLFGKILSLESRLGRLEEMRIFTEPAPVVDESSALTDAASRAAEGSSAS